MQNKALYGDKEQLSQVKYCSLWCWGYNDVTFFFPAVTNNVGLCRLVFLEFISRVPVVTLETFSAS